MFFCVFILFFASYASGFTCHGCVFTLVFALHDFTRADWLAIVSAIGGREALDLATVKSDNVASAVK